MTWEEFIAQNPDRVASEISPVSADNLQGVYRVKTNTCVDPGERQGAIKGNAGVQRVAVNSKTVKPSAHTPQVLIGIDTGRCTGLAEWWPTTRELKLFTLDFWSAYEHVIGYPPIVVARIRVEMPAKFMYYRHSKKQLGKNRENRMAVDYGGTIREAELLADRFESMGYCVDRPRPSSSKPDHSKFVRITGYDKRTNEHTRDAGMLVYDLNH